MGDGCSLNVCAPSFNHDSAMYVAHQQKLLLHSNNPTNKTLLMTFLLSSAAEIFVNSRRVSMQVGDKNAQETCMQRVHVPTELPFLHAPPLAGWAPHHHLGSCPSTTSPRKGPLISWYSPPPSHSLKLKVDCIRECSNTLCQSGSISWGEDYSNLLSAILS